MFNPCDSDFFSESNIRNELHKNHNHLWYLHPQRSNRSDMLKFLLYVNILPPDVLAVNAARHQVKYGLSPPGLFLGQQYKR